MPGGLRKADIEDTEIVDAVELLSDGTVVIRSGVTVVSTTSATKQVVLSGINIIYDKDDRLQSGDIVTLSGTSGGLGDGTFTINVIVDDVTFSVIQVIGNSTGGLASLKHPAGATKVGVNPTNLTFSSASVLQTVLEDVRDQKAKVSSNDTVSDYLLNKLTGDGITLTQVNDGGDEDLRLSLSTTSPPPSVITLDGGMMGRSGTSGEVVGYGYHGSSFVKNITDFGSYSIDWVRTPVTSVTLKVRFVIDDDSSANNYVRIAARVKARAVGENITTTFDNTTFEAVNVSSSSGGKVFSAAIVLNPVDFQNEDLVCINVGRDGANSLGSGTNDNFGKKITIESVRLMSD